MKKKSHCIKLPKWPISIVWAKTTGIGIILVLNIKIHHECEGGIEKFALRITHWHHEAGRVMTNGDQEGRIILFLAHH